MATKTEIVKNNVSAKVDWNLSKIKMFVETLMKVTLSNDLYELKNLIIIECVWKEVEKILKIDYVELKDYWDNMLHLQLFCSQPIYFNDIKIKIIEYMYGKGISNKKDIKWQNVTNNFDGFTSSFLYRLFFNLINLAKTKTTATKFGDLIKYLHDKYIPYLLKIPKDKMLPRLKYSEGVVTHISEDVKEMKLNKHTRNLSSDQID